MSIVYTFILITLGVLLQNHHVLAHGRLIDPPSRSSMWRFGFNNPINYNDNALYCGGYNIQWSKNGGKCGLCGDRFDGQRDNEAGGKYANGIIARYYKEGDEINVTVQLTQNHLGGYFEFNLCPVNDPQTRANEMCFFNNPVLTLDGKRRQVLISTNSGFFYTTLKLPQGVYCKQCVFRWKYNTATSWNCDGDRCCRGCGRQEQFYGCADVTIYQRNNHEWKTTTIPSNNRICEAKLPWRNNPAATPWCIRRCTHGECPYKYCEEPCRYLVHRRAEFSKNSRDEFWKDMLRASNFTTFAR